MECVSSTSFSLNINGTLHGYFKGKHGLRHGDPLSPYLFTLIMEVFTLMLQRRASESNLFTYHRYCDKLNLINLCFADDLFVFAHGDANSARVTMACLDEFKDVSGLGRFPVKYLGVPLISSRLVYSDCKELIEKASIFILPSRILLDIEQLMKGFLWCQGDMRKGKAKVPWEVVCLLRNERGLGIRKLDVFNKALMVSHIWNLLSLKESLWVKWIHVYKIKGRSFWSVPFRGNMTWG
ncbi:putative reverse transcriptase domain, reverse transcriptase zinc-binding domain protein [Tanacetum coccineum]